MVKYIREDIEKMEGVKTIPIDCIKGATILTAQQVRSLVPRAKRIVPANHNWWTKTPATNWCGGLVTVKSHDDHVNNLPQGEVNMEFGLSANNPYCAGIRPAVIIDAKKAGLKKGDIFEFGDVELEVISSTLALYGDLIMYSCTYNKNNPKCYDYEQSDVKRIVDDWFEKNYSIEKNLSELRYRPKPVSMVADGTDWGFD